MQRKPIFQSEATKDGKVRLTTYRKNGKPTPAELSPENAVRMACRILQDAQDASGAPQPGRPLSGLIGLNPSAIGISSPDPQTPAALIVYMGNVRFGLSIPNPRELGQALLAASASPDSKHSH